LIGGAKVQDKDYRRKWLPQQVNRRSTLRHAAPAIIIDMSMSLPARTPTSSEVRPSRRVFVAATALIAATAALFALFVVACAGSSMPASPRHRANELVVLMRPGPSSTSGAAGQHGGARCRLASPFAAEKNLALHFVAVDEVAQLYAGLANGEGQIAAGGLLRPPRAP
jgi:hypothetical protein